MQFPRSKFPLACGLSLLIVAGCQTYYPYGGYGYPGGVYSTPPFGPNTGNGTLFGPPTVIPPGDSLFAPQGPEFGTPGQQWQPAAPAQSTESDAPLFNGEQDEFDNPEKSNLVPEDPDAESLSSPFEEQGGAGIELRGIEDAVTKNLSVQSSDPFKQPISHKQADQSREVPPSSEEGTTTRRPSPYDFDRKNLSWLRGVVDHDEDDKSWHIIYNLNPDASDRFGGSMRLIPVDKLDGLITGDVVLVEGRVDSGTPDPFGKPQFQVDHLSRLVAKTIDQTGVKISENRPDARSGRNLPSSESYSSIAR